MRKQQFRLSAILSDTNKRRILSRNFVGAGQNLVEFTVILPLIFLILFGFVEIGRIIYSWILIESAVRQGANYAASKTHDTAYCLDGNCNTIEEINDARIESIKDLLWSFTAGITKLSEGSGAFDQDNFYSAHVRLRQNIVHPSSTLPFYQCHGELEKAWEGENVVVLVEYNHDIIAPLVFIDQSFIRMTARRDVYIREKDPRLNGID